MITDDIPRKKALKTEYYSSDAETTVKLPKSKRIQKIASVLETALAEEDRQSIEDASNELLELLAASFKIDAPHVKILGVRPREINEDSIDELYGDYDPNTYIIRLWMRTAVKQKVTSYGTFLHTLCHEFCHHLDVVGLNYPNTFHTRGFFERTALLYHHIRQTPNRHLVWTLLNDGTYRIDWGRTMQRKT